MPTAHIALGSNLSSPAGDPRQTLHAAMDALAALGVLTARSRLHVTAPEGYQDQPAFLNAAVALETELSPEDLLSHLLEVERRFGRDRSHGIRNGPRTLDLDLILYGDRIVNTDTLTLPHPRMHERGFVLLPLAEIAPEQIHPVLRKSVKELVQALTIIS